MKRLWLKSAKGLNVRIDPTRLEYNPENGVQWLTKCYNVDYDYTGRISRRLGWKATDITSNCHSLFVGGETCLFVSGGVLKRLGTNFGAVDIVTLGSNSRVSYCLLGDKIYYVNGVDRGIVRAGAYEAWEVPSTVYGPSTTRAYRSPPSGTLIGNFKGRMYVCQGDVIWYTEPYGPNLVDFTRNYLPFEAPIKMFHPVREGIYVGTTRAVWFLRGNSPLDFAWELVQVDGPVLGSDASLECSIIGDGQMTGIGVMWTSKSGICVGLQDGKVFNLTQKTLEYEVGTVATVCIVGDRYICCMPDTLSGALTLVLNLERVAAGQYLNYNFVSMAKFGDVYLGAKSNGIFEIDTGSLDGTAKITSSFTIPPTDFGFKGTKRLRYVELSYETDAPMLLTPIADEVEGNTVELYPTNKKNKQTFEKVAIGRYLSGRLWGLTLKNSNGADFSIDEINAELAGLRLA